MPKAKAEKSALPAKEAKKPKGGSGEKGQGRRATGSNTGLVSFFPYLIDEAARALHKYSNLAVYVDNEIGGGTEVLVDKLRQALRVSIHSSKRHRPHLCFTIEDRADWRIAAGHPGHHPAVRSSTPRGSSCNLGGL